MTGKMLQFIDVARDMPEKRRSDERAQDFGEIFRDFADSKAAEQAGRCSQCGVPFCQVHCPLHNNIPDWLLMTAAGRLEEAYALAQATNNFPEICGRICPQDRLCEGNCVLEQSGHETVTIGSVEKYITDKAWEEGWVQPVKPLREMTESVGIIGAGPAGLAAAEQLRRAGYQVSVYDRHDRIGGLLVYGIPNFKLEKSVVARRAKLIEDAGVTFHLNHEVGRDSTLSELQERHDAVLIACGVYRARDARLPGVGLSGVVPALDFLITSNRKGLGDEVPDFESGLLNAAGKKVVVIGGGDTAMDCVRTSVRQGAESVTCLYRRDRENMPGSRREVSYAEEEGVNFHFLAAPEAFLGDDRISGVRAIRMRLGLPDASGRQSPEPVEGSHFKLDADLVILALGFDPEDLPGQYQAPDLELTRWGTVKAGYRDLMSSIEGVFVAGDILRGASLVVWAVRDGRDAADRIDRYLGRKRKAAQMNQAAAE